MRTVRMIPGPAATATSDPYKWRATKVCRRGEKKEARKSEGRTWSPRTAADQRRAQSADGSLDDSIVARRLLPPASSSLCLCFNLLTFSCISRRGPLCLGTLERQGKHLQAFSTLQEEQNEQRNKSQTTICNCCYFKPFSFPGRAVWW